MKKKLLLVSILLAVGSALGQVSIGIRIGAPPPVRVLRVQPRSPGADYVWIGGYWYPVGNHYKWHDGYWTRPAYTGAHWVAPRHDGERFFEGHWDGDRGNRGHDHKWDRGRDHKRDFDRDHDHK